MKTVTINLYKFNELSPKAQETALDKLCDINVDHDWWDCTYDDAKNIGLEINNFYLDRNRHATGKLLEPPLQVINKIKTEHGQSCDTYKLACDWEEKFKKHVESEKYDDEHDLTNFSFEPRFDLMAYKDDCDEFKKALLEEYSIMLQKEYEYLTSREAIIETIEANDYDFYENGNLA